MNKWNELIPMTDHWARHIESVASQPSQNNDQILFDWLYCSSFSTSFVFVALFPHRTLTVEWILRSDIRINKNNFIKPMWCFHTFEMREKVRASIRKRIHPLFRSIQHSYKEKIAIRSEAIYSEEERVTLSKYLIAEFLRPDKPFD